ncbi:MAG: histidine phosphatase family protein [bacterium]
MVSTAVTHLHLLRHGAVESPTERSVRGQLDVPLAPEGERQSRILASWVKRVLVTLDPPVSGVLSSDLVRARRLGELVARELGVELVVEPALREQSMGVWEGQPWRVLNESDPAGVEAYWTRYLDARPGGGESVRDLGTRVTAWWEGARPRLENGRWILVTHIGVIRVFLCHAFGLELSESLRFTPEVASHTWLMLAESGAVVGALGERPWLGLPPP